MLMSALSFKARAVIEQAREEMRPAVGERERLEALLDAQIGAPPASDMKPASSPAIHANAWRWVTSLTVGTALVGGAAFLSLRPNVAQKVATPAVSAAAVRVTPPEAPPTPSPVVEAQPPVALEAVPSAKPATEAKPPGPVPDALAQEVSLLSRATSDLRSGRAGAALKLLDEHQRKFPNGMLAVERQAVRAQALCTLKRVSEGRAAIAQLAPQSPAAGRAKQLCDAAAASTQQ